MRLSDLLSAERIDPAFRAANKPEALERLGALLARGVEGVDAELVTRVLREREAVGSTGVGDEVAIPHGKLPGLKGLVAALAIAPQGIEFDAIDKRPVRIFIAILAPERAASEHLRALARCSKLLRDRRVRDELLRADSAAQVFGVVQREAAQG